MCFSRSRWSRRQWSELVRSSCVALGLGLLSLLFANPFELPALPLHAFAASLHEVLSELLDIEFFAVTGSAHDRMLVLGLNMFKKTEAAIARGLCLLSAMFA